MYEPFIVPQFSTATGWKMCVLSKTEYLVAFRVAAASAAEPAFVAESLMYDSAIIIIIIIVVVVVVVVVLVLYCLSAKT